MQTYTLSATTRTAIGSGLAKLRNTGIIPAVLYGNNKANTNIALEKIALNRVLTKAGENSLIQLTVEGEKEARNVLAHDVQLHPISDEVIHVDFLEVNLKEEIETEVPLVFVGESAAVKALDGTLITNKTEIEVRSLPTQIPHEIEVDLSKLATFEDSILAGDIALPAGVVLVTDPEETIALVQEPRSEEELAALDEKVEADVSAVGDAIEKKPEDEEAAE